MTAELPGLLRVLVLFHEAHALGAGVSVLRAVPGLEAYGWTASGWFPADGPIVPRAAECLAAIRTGDSPIAFSGRGWRAPPGVLARARGTPAYLRSVRAALLQLRPHVVHANTLLSLPEAAVARSCGIPVVLQSHELPDPGAKRTATLRAAGKVAEVLVAVSDAVAGLLREHAGRTPVHTVRNGVPDLQPARADGTRPFTVGTVGTVSRIKGTDVFLRAAQLALADDAGLRFVHVGARDLHRDAGLDEELAVIAASSAAPVDMLGVRPAESVLPDLDVFVLTSRSEAFSLATLEAMSAGLPVVATAVGGIPEQIEHLESGILVPAEDPAAVASWVLRLRDDPDLRRRLGEAAARRVRSEFTLARQAAGLHRAYLTALNLRFGPPVVRRRTLAAA